MRAFLVLLAAVNPPAVALALRPPERRVTMAAAAAIALALAIALGAASEAVLDALDVSLGTYRVAAGAVIGVFSLRPLIARIDPVIVEGATGSTRIAVPLLIPVLVTPQLAMASISTGADRGTLVVAGAAAVSLALAWLAATTGGRAQLWTAGARFVGALGVAVALSLVVDGVKTV
jgi:small neutral amino acid transporter SnatA (MarC family)